MPTSSGGRPQTVRPARKAGNPARSGNPAVRSAAATASGNGSTGRSSTSPAARGSGRRPNQRLILGVLLGVVVVVLIAAVGIFSWQKSHGQPEAPAAQPSFGPVALTNGRPIVLGHADAPVRLTLFEDFNCPHCANFQQNLGPTITDLQRSGRVKVELYPLSFENSRSPAVANAMACAATQGFGQAYDAGLFANFGLKWTDDQLIELGSVVGRPGPDFARCVRSTRYASWLDSITKAAQQQNVEQTPTVFINGVRQPDQAATWSATDLRSRIGAAK